MIIIDGFDNTGKTTLAKELQSEFDLTYLHSPSEYRYDYELMMDWAIVELGSKRKAIYDRFSPITDQVYGPVLRGGTPYLGDKRGRAIVELLRCTPHIIIYARPHRDRIFENIDGREQMDGVVDKARTLLQAYDDMFYRLRGIGYNVLTYDYEDEKSFVTINSAVYNHIINHLGGK